MAIRRDSFQTKNGVEFNMITGALGSGQQCWCLLSVLMMFVTSFEIVGKTRRGQEICHLVRSKAEASLADSNQAGSSNSLWKSGSCHLVPALLASI